MASPLSGWHTLFKGIKEVIALIVDDDEGGEILDFNFPDRFHAELFVFNDFNFGDAVLRQTGRRWSQDKIRHGYCRHRSQPLSDSPWPA